MYILKQMEYLKFRVTHTIKNQKGQFALDIALGLAVVLIISAFIIMPGLKTLSSTFMTNMTSWWTNTMSTKIFTTTGN